VALWAEDGEAREAAVREAKANLTLLEAQLAGKRFFGGDRVGFLDIAASAFAHWQGVFEEIAGVNLLAADEHPALCAWAKEYTADEAVRRCLPDREALLAKLTRRKETYVSTARAMARK
jgi:glutathione S-transferase